MSIGERITYIMLLYIQPISMYLLPFLTSSYVRYYERGLCTENMYVGILRGISKPLNQLLLGETVGFRFT